MTDSSALRSFTSKHPDNFQYWTLVFNYNAPCGPRQAPVTPTHAVQGVKLVFYDDDSDMLLLQQLSQIPKEFAPYYVGAQACRSALADVPCSC